MRRIEAQRRSACRAAFVALAALFACALIAACDGHRRVSRAVNAPSAAAASWPSTSSSLSALASAAPAAPSTGPDSDHEGALAALRDGAWMSRIDARHLISLPMPDGGRWTHVTFWGARTLAGWRYGDDHHAVVAVMSFPRSPGESIEGCIDRFVSWGRSRATAFDVRFGPPRVESFEWSFEGRARRGLMYVVDADRRAVFGSRRYFGAFAAYSAWDESCLVVGVAVPDGGPSEHGSSVRDRFVREALPGLTITPRQGRRALEATTFE